MSKHYFKNKYNEDPNKVYAIEAGNRKKAKSILYQIDMNEDDGDPTQPHMPLKSFMADFNEIGWEEVPSNYRGPCSLDEEWVEGYRRDDGIFVNGYCRVSKDRRRR